MKKTNVTTGSTSICVILFLIFLALKLTNYIDWSWWWITAPLWLPASIGIIVVIPVIAIRIVIAKRNGEL